MIVIADDLTGANDTAIQYKKFGISSIASVGVSEHRDIFSSYDVVSVNTDSRAMRAQKAYEVVFDACKKYCKTDSYVYKKIDSVLRGNPGTELEAVMNSLGSEVAFVCPAYPGNERILQNGILYAGGNEIDATQTLSLDMKRKVFLVPIAKVREGSDAIKNHIVERMKKGENVFLFDATNDKELEDVYKATISFKDKSVLCGSAGLAQFDARHLAENFSHKKSDAFPVSDGITLLITGSRNKETRNQIQKVTNEYKLPCIILSNQMIFEGNSQIAISDCLAAVEKQVKVGDKILVVAISSLFEDFQMVLKDSEENYRMAFDLSQCLAKLAVAIHDRYDLNAIISCGGDTTLQLCNQLGVYGIEPVVEVIAGTPLGLLIGGQADRLPVITKSGGFGGDAALVECIKFLNNRR